MYSELCLFDIFYEGEIMAFNDTFCETLVPLLNDKLSEYLLKFIEDVNNSDVRNDQSYIAERIRNGIECLERNAVPRAKVLTLHRDMHSKTFKGTSLFNYIRSMNLTGFDVLSLTSQEMQEVSGVIDEVLDLIPNMVERVEARKKKDYQAFRAQVECLEREARSLRSQLESQNFGGLIRFNTQSLTFICDKNQELFFSPTEAARTTNLHRVISKEQDLRSIRQGLSYIAMCDKRGISLTARRKI